MAEDLSEFEQLGPISRSRCSIAVAFEQLGEESDKLRAALAAEHIPHSNISRWLAVRGIKIKSHTIGRHRGGGCACDA